jgi:hypothetical protein
MESAYRHAIDGVSKESLLANLHGEGVFNRKEDVAWSLRYLREAQAHGLPIFAIEYLDATLSRWRASLTLARYGFIPFFGNRLLNRVPA